MKVGTDGVLLGLFASYMQAERLKRILSNQKETGDTINILDVGCGSGLVGLIVVQHLAELWNEQDEFSSGRPCVRLFGVDIDDGACGDAQRNYDAAMTRNAATWQSVVRSCKAMKCDARSGNEELEKCLMASGPADFDIIVCNPPFYSDIDLLPTHKCTEQQRISMERKRARFQSSFPPSDVAHVFSRWLRRSSSASFGALVYPVKHAEEMRDAIAGSSPSSSSCVRIAFDASVKDCPSKEPHRVLWRVECADGREGEGEGEGEEEEQRTICIHKREGPKKGGKEVGDHQQQATYTKREYSEAYARHCRNVYRFVD